MLAKFSKSLEQFRKSYRIAPEKLEVFNDLAIAKQMKRQRSFLSLRKKLLIGCSVVFCSVFGGAYYWFYTFASDRAIMEIRTDLEQAARGTASRIDVERLLELYREGEPNSDGFSSDPRYKELLTWFELVHELKPKIWPYTYVVIEDPSESIRTLESEDLDYPHTRYLVDVWANHDVDSAAGFLEVGNASDPTMEAYKTGELVFRDLYGDEFGKWMSAYLPMIGSDGQVSVMLGVDVEADYVTQIQNEIRSKMFTAFLISYAILLICVVLISSLLTNRLNQITSFAKKVGTGDYSDRLIFHQQDYFSDEMEILANVLNKTIDNIRRREELIQKGREVEIEIRAELEEERELNDLKSRFVSMISHELRTPLTVIQTSNEMLEKFHDRLDDKKRGEYLNRVRDSVKNMTNLLEDVLFLGKAESGKIPFSPQEVDLIQYCQELIEEMELGDRDVHTINFSCVGQAELAHMDMKCLRSILTNLISNAFKYSPASTQVDLNLIFQSPDVIFEIRDRGIGIPDKDQESLFERFHRASNVKNIRGTGLGLAIVAQCVQKQKGEINFWSKENLGTIFNIKMPLDVRGDEQVVGLVEPDADESAASVLLEYQSEQSMNTVNA